MLTTTYQLKVARAMYRRIQARCPQIDRRLTPGAWRGVADQLSAYALAHQTVGPQRYLANACLALASVLHHSYGALKDPDQAAGLALYWSRSVLRNLKLYEEALIDHAKRKPVDRPTALTW